MQELGSIDHGVRCKIAYEPGLDHRPFATIVHPAIAREALRARCVCATLAARRALHWNREQVGEPVPEFARDAHWDHRRKLAISCRIMGMLGYVGAFGHISLRVPGTDIVLITPGAGSEKTTVRADQIFVYDLDGKVLHHPGGDTTISEPAEFPIHTRIHRDRPEIMCVAHLHAPNSTLLGIVNRPIVPVFSQAFFLQDGIPVWDNPRLVVSDNVASQLSQALGSKIACQMRGHGSVVVGETAEETLWNCFAIEENARYQIAAEPFGGPALFSSDILAEAALQRKERNAHRNQLVWAYFERKVAMTGLPI